MSESEARITRDFLPELFMPNVTTGVFTNSSLASTKSRRVRFDVL